MGETIDFYDYETKNGVVSAKGLYKEEGKEAIPLVVVMPPSGIHHFFSEVPFLKEKQECIFRAFQRTLKTAEE